MSTFALHLKIENFVDDEELDNEWPTWYEDLTNEPADCFALIALAIHTVISDSLKARNINHQLKKIFVRPVGWQPVVDIIKVFETNNTLVSTVGVVKRIEPIEAVYRFVSYRCKLCSAEVFVLQNQNIKTLTRPSKCTAGCKARGGFTQLMTSPFTVVVPTQTIVIQEICYEFDEQNRSLEVQLNEDQVDSVFVGSEVNVTGMLKYRADKTTRTDGTTYVPYLQALSVFIQTGPGPLQRSVEKKKMPDIVPILRGDPDLFKVLINSLCPEVYGRQEAKAALLLALFSGYNINNSRRSNSHVMLLGNPGTAKSTLLVSVAKAAPRGMLVSGIVATQAGMTASVSNMGTIEAGALILSDNGVCCIDEFDKMKNPYAILLEPMEQQSVSLSKCGAVSSMPARCSIIAAANPVDNVYDVNKTMVQNINLLPQLISRFDLIVPFLDNMDVGNQDLTHYMESKNRSTVDCEFFDRTQSTSSVSSHWLKKSHEENVATIPLPALKQYIEYSQQNFCPKMTIEAGNLIKSFFMEYTNLIRGNEQMNLQGSARIIESVLRLTLSRARAEMQSEATVEHAQEVIDLFKYTQIDIYERTDVMKNLSADKNESKFGIIKRVKKPENIGTMSKSKQMKAFLEFLNNKCDEEERNDFTRAELKEMAEELGIKDVDDVVYRLNNEGFLLKTVNGYRVVSI